MAQNARKHAFRAFFLLSTFGELQSFKTLVFEGISGLICQKWVNDEL